MGANGAPNLGGLSKSPGLSPALLVTQKGGVSVALSHDWLNGMRGGEKCLEVLCELFPEATLFTLFQEPGKVTGAIASRRVRVSRVQTFPKVFTHYRYYLPFFPSAVETKNGR